MAAVSHPLFKLSWVEDADMRAKGTQMMEQAVRDNNRDPAEVSADLTQTMPTGNTGTAPQLDDFFSFTASTMQEPQQHLEFLNDQDKNVTMLNKHRNIKRVFISYNKTLPSSAPVERLFSVASIVLSKRRNRLNDNLFESFLLMKINKLYW